MKKIESIIFETPWLWVVCGGVLGYFVIHPAVMIIAYPMLHSGLVDTSFLDVIRSELLRLFATDMMPWSGTFTLISAIAAGFLGHIRSINPNISCARPVFNSFLSYLYLVNNLLISSIAVIRILKLEFTEKSG